MGLQVHVHLYYTYSNYMDKSILCLALTVYEENRGASRLL